MKHSVVGIVPIGIFCIFSFLCANIIPGHQYLFFANAQVSTHDNRDLEDDHELLAALEIFAGMSPDEMMETVKQMMNVIGNDDLETLEELKKILELIPLIQSDSSLLQMVKDDEIAVATNDALRMIGENSDWDMVWEMQDVILESVIASGKLTPEDAATFKTDEMAWKKELKFIYDELQKQAKAMKKQQQGNSEL